MLFVLASGLGTQGSNKGAWYHLIVNLDVKSSDLFALPITEVIKVHGTIW